ncbi:hypothetical protein F2Q69_00037688 [Brassica cretica]|uniref:Uncharacterized protein n=1 Tax=Brassica cretica TaxID=69181 RepID=A0A8S9SC54_BRACR|nr:hypothetical protein F2Q69_00037688 [Brassica cretica]
MEGKYTKRAIRDGMMDEEDDYEVYVTQSPHPTQGVEDVPLAPNRRVNALQPATIIIIDDEDDASYTGSSNGINENDNITSAPPPEDIELIANEQPKSAPAIRKGESSAEAEQNKTPPSHEVVVALPAAPIASNVELCLDLTLGVGKNMSSSGTVPLWFTYPGTERVYDLVNHIGCVFRYFIVDVVDPGSTPDVERCGRELDEQFLSHEQG